MAIDPRAIDEARYGVIQTLHSMLASSLEVLVLLLLHQERVDIRPFLAVADGVIATLQQLMLGQAWRDAHLQMLTLAYRYRDLITALALTEPAAFRRAAAELSEAQTMAAVAMYRLAEQLDLRPVETIRT